MSKVAAFVFLVLTISAINVHADQALWGPVSGRTSEVRVLRKQYGDVLVQIGITSQSSPLASSVATTVLGSCEGSNDPTCQNLAAPKVGSTTCSLNSLNSYARQSLFYLFGPCSLGCVAFTGTTLSGEAFVEEVWTCSQGTYVAECTWMNGTMTPALRIDGVLRNIGCI